jgi:transcriptional regulator with XRE-family HTH domain
MKKQKAGRPKKQIKKQLEGFEKKGLTMLGNRIKMLRIEAGYSNYEYFAYDHNISRAQYGKYEKGANISFTTLLKIMKAHKMTIEEFFSEGF